GSGEVLAGALLVGPHLSGNLAGLACNIASMPNLHRLHFRLRRRSSHLYFLHSSVAVMNSSSVSGVHAFGLPRAIAAFVSAISSCVVRAARSPSASRNLAMAWRWEGVMASPCERTIRRFRRVRLLDVEDRPSQRVGALFGGLRVEVDALASRVRGV